MKKSLFIIALSTLALGKTEAQLDKYDYRERLSFGFKAGLNISNVYDSKGEEFRADAKAGFAGGAFLCIPIGKYVGIQPELMFSQKGFQSTGVILGSTYSMTRTTSYIDVPILLQFKPIPYVSIVAGPQYSYLIKQSDEFAAGSTTTLQEQEFKADNIRENTLCFTGGLDIQVTHYMLALRFGIDILNNNGDGTSTTPRYKNLWYQATLGYRF